MNENREIVLKFLAHPNDVNFGGKVHGGNMMKWIDEAGFACATRWSSNYCVTAYVGDINFHAPVKIGSLMELTAKVVYTGNTSIHIAVEVRSCDLKQCDMTPAMHCILVFVAIDEQGKPIKVPKWQPKTPKDLELENYAKKFLESKNKLRAELGRWSFS